MESIEDVASHSKKSSRQRKDRRNTNIARFVREKKNYMQLMSSRNHSEYKNLQNELSSTLSRSFEMVSHLQIIWNVSGPHQKKHTLETIFRFSFLEKCFQRGSKLILFIIMCSKALQTFNEEIKLKTWLLLRLRITPHFSQSTLPHPNRFELLPWIRSNPIKQFKQNLLLKRFAKRKRRLQKKKN